ncbi:MAG: immunity protein YezG family protein, partial [Clostridium sp.]
PEAWSNFTMYLNSKGKFKIDFAYEDVLEMPGGLRKDLWRYKNLGIYPTNENTKRRLIEYLKENNITDKI